MATAKKHRIVRKTYSPTRSIGEWSRMLHKWWMKDIQNKFRFKNNKLEY